MVPPTETAQPQAGAEIAIRCTGVHKTYVSGDLETSVLRGIDLDIRRGELTVILGASGAGKSTLLNIIGGIDRPSSGEVWCGGQNLAELSDQALTEYRRRSVGCDHRHRYPCRARGRPGPCRAAPDHGRHQCPPQRPAGAGGGSELVSVA